LGGGGGAFGLLDRQQLRCIDRSFLNDSQTINQLLLMKAVGFDQPFPPRSPSLTESVNNYFYFRNAVA
jgi:hypothetical protein